MKEGSSEESLLLPPLPGPKPLPIIGNLHQLSELPHVSLAKLADKYGPVMLVKMGMKPLVIISSTEAAKLFFKIHDRSFVNRPENPTVGGVVLNSMGIVFAQYGDYWRHSRKTSVLHLFTAKKVQSFARMRERHVCSMIESIWEDSIFGSAVVNINDAFLALTSNFSLHSLIGKSYTREMSTEFGNLLHELSGLVGRFNPGDFIPALGFLDLLGINKRARSIKRTFFEAFDKVIAEHEGNSEIEDMVDALLDMASNDQGGAVSIDHIKNLMLDLYIASAETTSTALIWVMTELIRHREAIDKLKEEIGFIVGKTGKVNESSLHRVKYLDCVIKEALRLHPPAPLSVPRVSVEDVTMMRHCIPAKTQIMVNVWAIGRDPNVWKEDCEEFKPERFMDEEHVDMSGMNELKMIPFGGGRRGCPGFAVALPLIKLAIGHMVWDLDWVVEGGPSSVDTDQIAGITTTKKNPLRLIPKRDLS